MIRFEKIWGDLVTRKARTVLVSASIFIGVVGVVALFSMGDILIDTLTTTIRPERLAMLRSYVWLKNDQPLTDHTYLDDLRALPGLEQFQAMMLLPVYWKPPGAADLTEGRIFGYSVPPGQAPLEPPDLVSGRWPEPGRQEIAVERRFASAHGIRPGDPLVLRVLEGGVHEETWTVTGTVFQPYPYPMLPGSPVNIPSATMIFGTVEDVRRVTGTQRYNLLLARFTDYPAAEAQTRRWETTIAEKTPYVTYITLSEDPVDNTLVKQIYIFDQVISLLAMVALTVAGFLVLTIINALVIEQRRQIGVMKSLGATGWDTFVMYAGLALAYGVIGTVPGVLVGIPLGYTGTQRVAQQMNLFLPGFTVSWPAVIVGAALGIVVPVGAAVGPVLLGIRVTILEAITDLGITTAYIRGPLARLIDALRLPITLRQSFRNVTRKKGRLALMIVTLSLAAGAFMGVFAAITSFLDIVSAVMDQVGIDISITPNRPDDFAPIRALIEERVEGLQAVEPGTTLAVDVEGYTPQQRRAAPAFLIASGINTANPALVNFRLIKGRGWADEPSRRGVVLSNSIATSLKRKPGDTVVLRIGSRSDTFEVLGVTDYLFDTVWMRWQDLSRLAGLVRGAPVPNRYTTSITVDGIETPAIGLDEQARPFIPFTSGGFFTAGQPGAIVSTALAERGGYAVGDELTLAAGEQAARLPITGIFTIPPPLAQPGQPDAVIGLFWEDLAALEGVPLDGEPVPNGLQLIMQKRNPTAAEVADKIDAINTLLVANGLGVSYTNWVETLEAMTQMLKTAGAVLNIAALLIGAVGAIGLLSSLSMSVFERQKEIGVMRSVGATSSIIALQFLVEGLLVGAAAWVLGIPLSLVLHNALVSALGFQGMPGAEYPPGALALGLVVMLLIAAGASLWPSIAAARKTVSDILRYQ